MRTVHVIEGFTGGRMHSRHFRKALEQAGFKNIRDRHKADIIIAHSAGIYAIPADSQAKLLMLIGPTYWPGVNLLKRAYRHTRDSGRHHLTVFGMKYYIWKQMLNFYYFFRRHIYLWYGVINNNRLAKIEEMIKRPERKTIIIRNRNDSYCSPDLKNHLKHASLTYVELPGVHDDFVSNPQPYIDLLRKEYN